MKTWGNKEWGKDSIHLLSAAALLFIMFACFSPPCFSQTPFLSKYPAIEKKATHFSRSHPDSLIQMVDFWVDSLHANSDSCIWMYLMLYKVEPLLLEGNYAGALKIIGMVEKQKQNLKFDDPYLNFRVLKLTGNCQRLLNKKGSAMTAFHQALELAQSLNDSLLQAEIYIDLSEVLRHNPKKKKGMEHLLRAEKISIEANLGPFILARIYDRFAAYFEGETGMEFGQKALEYARQAGDIQLQASALLLIGYNHPGSEKLLFYQRAAALFKKSGDQRNQALTMLNLARTFKTDFPVQAILYLDTLERLRRGRNWPYLIEEGHRYYIETFKKLGNIDSALAFQERLYVEERIKRVKEESQLLFLMQSRYDEEKQSALIRKQDLKAAQSRSKVQWLIFTVVITGMLLLFLILFLVRLRKSKLQIESQAEVIREVNIQLKGSLDEKEVLMQEIHHRVKNNLQIISSLLEIESELNEDPQLHKVMQGAQGRIRSIALVHEMIYREDKLETLNMDAYIGNLANEMLMMLTESEAPQLNIDCQNLHFSLEKAVHLGILLNELLTNSLKHARQKGKTLEIHIRLRELENSYSLLYRDNGQGLKAGLDGSPQHSIGMYLLKSMARQLRGKIEYRFNEGAEFELLFKRLRSAT